LGKNIKYVKKFIPVLVPIEKIGDYLKNGEVQEALQKGFQWTIKAAKIAIENSEIDRNLDLINNGMDGLAALIQGKEYTYEHKGVIYSLGQAFDETEKGEDKFAKGNVSGAYLNFEGEALGFLQTVYLNYENNCSSLENGHGFQEFQRKMDYSAFEKQHFERMGKRPVGERLSGKSAVLGCTYKMIMDIGTDPLTYITGEGIVAGIFGKTGKGASIVGKTDDLLKGTKTAGIEIKGAAGELDTVLKQGDNAVSGILDAKKAAKGSSDNIIGGVSKGKGKTGTAWDKVTGTADNIPNTEIPTTFKIDLDSNINYINPQTGTSTLWTNTNATKHMGEYIGRFGGETASTGVRSQAMVESYQAALNQAMEEVSSLPTGRYFGTYGNWEIGINTETGVVYHALMN